jgi:three-Cys-motif partner protein
LWSCDLHTKAKHELLEKYLGAWYPILLQAGRTSVTYAEGFAGPGIYEGGEPGSPVVAAGVFLRRRHFLDAGKSVTMVLVDADNRRLARLKQEMDARLNRNGRPPSTLRVIYEHGECGERLLPSLKAVSAQRGPIFAFLDSFGGPDIPLGVARAIALVPSSEVLVTFGTSFLTRFGTKDAHQQSGDEVFGGPAWRAVNDLPAEQKKTFLVNCYRQSLRRAGFRFVISFEMIDDTGHDLHLVFGTSSLKGLEKMKDAMWAVDPVKGVHYRDPRDPAQMMLDFDLHPALEPLRRAILTQLLNGPLTLAQLQDYALRETVYRGPHVTRALPQLITDRLAERNPAAGQLSKQTRIRITAHGREYAASEQPSLF